MFICKFHNLFYSNGLSILWLKYNMYLMPFLNINHKVKTEDIFDSATYVLVNLLKYFPLLSKNVYIIFLCILHFYLPDHWVHLQIQVNI